LKNANGYFEAFFYSVCIRSDKHIGPVHQRHFALSLPHCLFEVCTDMHYGTICHVLLLN